MDLRNTNWISVFGYCDQNTWNDARVENSVKKTNDPRRVFLAFRKNPTKQPSINQSEPAYDICYFINHVNK